MKGAPEAFCRRSAVFLDHIGAMSRLICHKPDARRPLGLRSPAGPTTDLVTKPRAFRPYTGPRGDPYPAFDEPGGDRCAFFLRSPLRSSAPLQRCECFTGDTSWLAPLATAAEEDGEQLYFRIGPSWASGWAARKVVVTLGQPHQRGEGLVVPLSWRATDLPGLFPVLDGDIELLPLGQDRCRVSLSASYVPPLGELGRRLNRAILHRVAKSTSAFFSGQGFQES